ncbi:hypothetical protein N9X61_02470 [Sulfurimonas sp.]|nr:hypothetical protein [Sulfurimonas sp.]
MEQFEVTKAIEKFMHPTVYTGVKPILLVAEELVTEQGIGQVVEAVWIGLNSNEEFSYISKFAVTGKIILGKYYQESEMEPFAGRLALISDANLENVVLHQNTVNEINKLESKRSAILGEIDRDFESLYDIDLNNKELYFFEKKDGDWEKELFSDLNINTPYQLISVQKKLTDLYILLENTKTGKRKEYLNTDKFYGYFSGSQADIAGLKLKSESYLQSIISLKNDAKVLIKNIEWLDLDDSRIEEMSGNLPKYPFEDYFPYVKKENVRNLQVPDELVEILKKIILKHMPENNTPLGMEYIPIDKLLYLFHMIISRDDALSALEMCDIVYEPPGMLLGHGGERKLPPKFLVPITHVASTYQKFSSFMSVCENFIDEK